MNPLQKSDDKHYFDQPGSGAGMAETLLENDSPNVVLEVTKGTVKEKTISPINKGTRDGHYTEQHDKDVNLRNRFVDKTAVDAQSR